ncbi:MAG TPA: hypothetical protein VLF94_08480, partial [Chlamydiales bacterium]|nr:hypothetical protein [Chlamydiales bacterium]
YRRGRARTETQRRRGKILEISLKTSGLNPAEAHELCNGLIVFIIDLGMKENCSRWIEVMQHTILEGFQS